MNNTRVENVGKLLNVYAPSHHDEIRGALERGLSNQDITLEIHQHEQVAVCEVNFNLTPMNKLLTHMLVSTICGVAKDDSN